MPTLTSPNPTSNPSISDFRRNADRQRREQRTTTTILSSAASLLIGSIILVAVLAGFGGYVLWKQIQSQSVTVAQLDSRLSESVTALANDAADTKRALEEQMAVNQQLQDRISKLATQNDRLSSMIVNERAARAKELAPVLKRVQKIENRLSERSTFSP